MKVYVVVGIHDSIPCFERISCFYLQKAAEMLLLEMEQNRNYTRVLMHECDLVIPDNIEVKHGKKIRSIAEVCDERKEKHGSKSNTFDSFQVGDKVKIVCACQDMHFFEFETGVVESITKKYLGIRVRFDEPRIYEAGKSSDEWTMETFNFEPTDLVKI